MAQSAVSVVLKLSRLSLQPSLQGLVAPLCQRCFHTRSTPLLFHATDQLWGSPLKKKKKLDPAVLLARENKRKKKIERQMKRIEKLGRRLKPVDEIEGDPKLVSQFRLRRRQPAVLTFEESESRALLQKQWSRFKFGQAREEMAVVSSLVLAQERALEELRFESPELYQQAIQLDMGLVPLEFKGPTVTPPIKGYHAPDGEFVDTTKTFEH